ncbi:hypothetical protein TWF569_000701 [Orbilia oligospora]|uniref:Uncharacterized protein n=1 Tax=Orbilia oligospora TaxID=2813651 RepID=A0A7C8J952_ORBOL|nr:hypothetical protein TWF103_001867 [Orbilia oligospora]KAF3097762.1 hypothetical protein TWF102_006274 [Orbilia oligospora]KAF3102148.1 hypothetical protein TWF706_005308 [Orbilia oligospora]KAF3117615.1 hypothetical protein TWF703_007155 [Orbilia oligospora]KAF3123928.1 hypothetical protein TWF594_002166 [Orbilia oligospora]
MGLDANTKFILLSLGVVLGIGLTVLMARAFYINYTLSKARRMTTQTIQQGVAREVSMQERRYRGRRVARSGRARGDYYDLESGLREPPPVHLSRDYEDPLPLYELPPEYSAIAKPGQRTVPSEDPVPYDQIDLHHSPSIASSSTSSASSSRHSATIIPEQPPFYSVAIR